MLPIKTLSSFLLFASLTLVAYEAQAQEMYDSSAPTHGEVMKAMPSPMSINFSEGIYLTKIRVLSADGKEWTHDWKKVEEDVFKAEFNLTQTLPPGKYQIEWTAFVRQHHHPDGGVIVFTIDPEAVAGTTDIMPAVMPPAAAVPPAARD
jgi:methionine-rich copper-binding protein CopC